MALNLKSPEAQDLRPRITVFGVGGAGGNAVNNMIEKALDGAEFVVANTDAQALQQSKSTRKLQLGITVTQGLGAGAKPEIGSAAAEESLADVVENLEGSHMCFITAGMGGGTGTGAAPVIARAAREMGILTVGVVTKPFQFEGSKRMRLADEGIEELQQVVDTLIIIPNQNLFRIANERTTFAEAFMMADDVLYQGVKGVTDLMVRPGLINLDFADVRSVMDEMGKAMMGTGEAEGETRAVDAAEKAIANPLLDEVSLKGARGVLINITGGYDLTLFELDEAANRIRAEVDSEANIIVGSTLDPDMEGAMRVSVVATGIDALPASATRPEPRPVRAAPPPPRALEAPAPVAEAAPVARAPEPIAAAPEPEDIAEGLFEVAGAQIEPVRAPSRYEDGGAFIAPAPISPEEAASDPEPAPEPEPVREEARAEAAPQPVPLRPAPARPALVETEGEAEGEDERGRFGINSLIHRMTGTARAGGGTVAAPPRREPGVEPAARGREIDDEEDARMEIPAFLRRQAN